MILIHQALSVPLQKRRQARLPLFDYNMCEMGSKLHRSLLPFTQRAPVITNDNSEISEGCLSEMVGSFDRLPRHVELQWQRIHSEGELCWWVYALRTACALCDVWVGNEQEWEGGRCYSRRCTKCPEMQLKESSIIIIITNNTHLIFARLSSFIPLSLPPVSPCSIVHWCPLTVWPTGLFPT